VIAGIIQAEARPRVILVAGFSACGANWRHAPHYCVIGNLQLRHRSHAGGEQDKQRQKQERATARANAGIVHCVLNDGLYTLVGTALSSGEGTTPA
jgi:hypothetical protein